ARAWVKSTNYFPDDEDALANAFMYAVTKHGEAGKIAVEFLQKVLADDAFKSGDPTRWHGEIAILIYDWCFELISPKDRAAFEAYADKSFDKWNKDAWGGVGHEEGNYYWGNLRNGLEWGLATTPENPRAAGFLEDALVTRWEKSFLPYAQKIQKGGVPSEGTQYGRYQLGYLLVPFVTLQTGGRKIFDETDFFRGAVYYTIHNALPGVTTRADKPMRDMFPHEDDEFWIQGASGIDPEYGDFMTTMALTWPDRPVGKHARWWLGAQKPKRSPTFESTDPGGTPAELTTIPLDYYAPGTGYLWTRNKWASDASVVFAQFGYAAGQGHQHMDSGSFQLWRKGRWLSRETASYIDEIVGAGGTGKAGARESIGHNAILFGGKGSALGYWDGMPRVLRLESRKDYAYVATDLSTWYRASKSDHTDRDDNPHASKLVRELIYLRDLETIVVFDRMESSGDSRDRRGWSGPKLDAESVAKTFVLHFEQTAKVTIDKTSVLGVNGDQALRMQTLVPAQPTYKLVDERLKPDDPLGQQRLELDTKGTAQSYFLNVLQMRDASAPNLEASVVEDANGFVATIKHPTKGTVTIQFMKGMGSAGGTIATPGCTAHALADYVQNIRLTDDGPIWGP
ncbi:MAG: heparinase II/III family protein, partial [Deltaproteobacteria bacterium]|nr:heparinase II/III family protein [Deltaproteobacteria bacterium]